MVRLVRLSLEQDVPSLLLSENSKVIPNSGRLLSAPEATPYDGRWFLSDIAVVKKPPLPVSILTREHLQCVQVLRQHTHDVVVALH